MTATLTRENATVLRAKIKTWLDDPDTTHITVAIVPDNVAVSAVNRNDLIPAATHEADPA